MKLAVVGMGHFGPGRLAALGRRADVGGLVACDHHPHKLEAVARDHPAVQLETSYARVLDDPTVDAVVLSTPIHTHAELGLAALEAGKHLLVEKPLASSVHEAERLVEAARARGLVLMVGHTFEHSAAARAMGRLCAEGVLGELRYASMRRVGLGRHQKGVSVLWDLAIHDVASLMSWIGGPPLSVQLHGRSVLGQDGLDVSFLGLRFENGAVANIESSWLAPEKSRLIQLVGSRAALEYRADESEESLRLIQSQAVITNDAPSYHRGEVRPIELFGPPAVDRELEVFLAAVQSGLPPAGHLEHALAVTRVLEQAEAAWS